MLNSLYLSTDRNIDDTLTLWSKLKLSLKEYGFKATRKKVDDIGYLSRRYYRKDDDTELILSHREEESNNGTRYVIILEAEDHHTLLEWVDILHATIKEYDRLRSSLQAEISYARTMNEASKPRKFNFEEGQTQSNLILVTKGKVPKVFNNGCEIEFQDISVVYKEDQGWIYQIKMDGKWYDINTEDNHTEIWL